MKLKSFVKITALMTLVTWCGYSMNHEASASAPTTFNLKFTSATPAPPFTNSVTAKWWADEVAKRSNGRIQWSFFWVGALTKPGEELEAIQSGLADAGTLNFVYHPGKLPLNNFTYAVPFGPSDPKMLLKIAPQMYKDVPELNEEIEQYNQKLVFPVAIDTYNITSKKPILTVDDLKGVKIGAIGNYYPKALNGAGAVSVQMPMIDRYQALQSGIIEADLHPFELAFVVKLHELNKHATWVGLGADIPMGVSINMDTWKKLPADLQKLMLEVGVEAMERHGDLVLERRQASIDAFKKAGVTMHEMKEEERGKWAKMLPDMPADWIAAGGDKMEKYKHVMTHYLELAEKAGYKFPRKWAEKYR